MWMMLPEEENEEDAIDNEGENINSVVAAAEVDVPDATIDV